MTYTLSQELVQEVLDYLSKKPAGEVFVLVNKLMQLVPNEISSETTSKEQLNQEVNE